MLRALFKFVGFAKPLRDALSHQFLETSVFRAAPGQTRLVSF